MGMLLMIGVEIKVFSFDIRSLTVRRGVACWVYGSGEVLCGCSQKVLILRCSKLWRCRNLKRESFDSKGKPDAEWGLIFCLDCPQLLDEFPCLWFSFMLCVSQTALRRAGCSFPCNFSSSRLACVSSIKQIGMQRKKKGSRSEEDLFSLNGS